jgi:hypothetical protein
VEEQGFSPHGSQEEERESERMRERERERETERERERERRRREARVQGHISNDLTSSHCAALLRVSIISPKHHPVD